MSRDESFVSLFSEANTIAVLGLNDDPGTPSYRVASYIQSQGYDLIPVNPNIDISLGHPAVDTLKDIQQQVDIVDVFTNRVPLEEIGRDAKEKGAKAIWLQPGVAPEGAPSTLSGIPVVYNKCFMTEHRRLLSDVQL